VDIDKATKAVAEFLREFTVSTGEHHTASGR
jgi:hypothetical protein